MKRIYILANLHNTLLIFQLIIAKFYFGLENLRDFLHIELNKEFKQLISDRLF